MCRVDPGSDPDRIGLEEQAALDQDPGAGGESGKGPHTAPA